VSHSGPFKATRRTRASMEASNGNEDTRGAVHKASSHYEAHTAESYESAFFYSPGEYMTHLQKLVRSTLKVADDSKRRLLDLGGGTGNFTRMIVEGTPMDAVCVDPFLTAEDLVAEGDPESDPKRARRQLHFIKAPAEDFAKELPDKDARVWWMRGYHQVLLKEVVHHIAKDDRVSVFRGLRAGLAALPKGADASPPAVLIMTRPQRDIDYPMWPEAKEVWAKNQPDVEDIQADLRAAGFTNVNHIMVPYTCRCELAQWQTMVKRRFWSTFVEFSDEQLEAGCEWIGKERVPDADGKISFDDRMLYITADA